MGELFFTTREQIKLHNRVVEKIQILSEFGFNSSDLISMDGENVVKRDLMVKLLSDDVPPVVKFLNPSPCEPPNWVKEIVTEVKSTKDGIDVTC